MVSESSTLSNYNFLFSLPKEDSTADGHSTPNLTSDSSPANGSSPANDNLTNDIPPANNIPLTNDNPPALTSAGDGKSLVHLLLPISL